MKAGWAGKVWGKFSRVIYGLLAEQELNLLPLPSQAVCWSCSQPPPGWAGVMVLGTACPWGNCPKSQMLLQAVFPSFLGFFWGVWHWH